MHTKSKSVAAVAKRVPNLGSRVASRGLDTRIGLLEAAERILIEEGFRALTVRRIGAVATLNPALVNYHFGSVSHLMAELCRCNVEPMLEDWATLSDADRTFASIREVLEAWLIPLRRPAAFTRDGRALIVLDEIASHGGHDLRDNLLQVMIDISMTVQRALRPFTPHLDQRTLRARVRFLSAATLGPPPRSRVVPPESDSEPLDSSRYLIDLAVAALTTVSD